MIHINKPIVYSGITIAFAALALTGLGMKEVEAVSFSPTEIVSRIATRFNLNKDDVQSVFNTFREQRQSQMIQAFSTRLDDAVKTGKITDAQKSLILNKMKEEQTTRDNEASSWKSMTPEERRADRKKHQDEIQQWATANNIPIEFLMQGHIGKRMGMGRGM